MKRLTTILLIFIFSLKLAHGLANPYWIQIDKNLLRGLVKLSKDNPELIENYFYKLSHDSTKDKKDLGFGWKMWETGYGGGYISITATFYYYKDTLVSYILRPELPGEKRLYKRYLLWYYNYFTIDSLRLLPYYYNYDKMLKPLDAYCGILEGDNIPKIVLDYMSPTSGTMFGFGSNRNYFNKIKDNLSLQQIELIMFSINPDSRFTANEYYNRNQEKFINSNINDAWIERNFIEIPIIKTQFGCRLVELDSKLFFSMFKTSRHF